MSEINKGFYAIIPANIRYDNEIPSNAKLLYSEITALCNVKGYCWPGNDYFAELYGVSERTIYRWISKLIKKGYIFVEYNYKPGTKEILKRYIKLAESSVSVCVDNSDLGTDKNVSTSCQSCHHTGTDKNVSGGGDKNVRDNNINNNIYINNNTICHSDQKTDCGQVVKKDIYKTVMDLYIKTCTMLPKPIKLTDARKKSIKNLIEMYSMEQIENAFKNINSSVFCTGKNDRGWKADFDFCINSNKVTSALEGKYTFNAMNQNKNQDKPKPANRFHNFTSSMGNYSESDFEEIARRKREKLLKGIGKEGRNNEE